MKNKKGTVAVIAIIIIVVTIVAGAGGWFAKKTQAPIQQTTMAQPALIDETAGWKTYTNTEYGLEFKYPVSYEFHLGDPKQYEQSLFFVKNPKKDLNPNNLANLNYYAFSLDSIYPNFLGNNGKIENSTEWAKYQNEINNIQTETTIGGKIAYMQNITVPESELKIQSYVFFINNGIAYDAYYFTIKKDDIGEKILSTLKFIKNKSDEQIANTQSAAQPATQVTSADKTANWQTYKNDKYGFELKIPNDWTPREENIQQAENGDKLNQVGIIFSTQNKGETFNVMFIIVTPTDQLKLCSETILCNPGGTLGEHNGYTFGTVAPAAGGVDTDYINKYMEEKIKDVPTVMDTFKFTK